jgi:NADH-ubiquinone oxidoreductase chain 6
MVKEWLTGYSELMVSNVVNTELLKIDLYIIKDIFTNGYTIDYLELLSLFAIISGILIITYKNPIISVLFLILLFLEISIYLIVIGLNFIGISYILVYIGAVSMLFLFILMLIDIRVSELHIDNNNNIFLSFIVSILIFFLLNINNFYDIFNESALLWGNKINSISSNNWDISLIENYDIINIGNILYTNYSIWLIITSLILLLAMIGAIIINIS